MNIINRLLVNRRFILILFLIIAVFASLQSYFGGLKGFETSDKIYTHYNNYIIFKQSFFHLIEKKDLYQLFLKEQWDLFKYSPTFALLFGILAVLPDVLGLSLWNILNAAILFFSVYYLPKINIRTKGIILLFIFPELLTTLQNEQSNALITGLLIFTFGFLERGKYWLAALCIVSTIFIKLFGIVGLALYLLYPNKFKLSYTLLIFTILCAILPLLVVDFNQFIFLYKSWANMLANDHSISDGLSVIGWLKAWFGWQVNKTFVSLAGAVLFCIPLLRIKEYTNYNFRILILASILIWVVIFNHRAESPTFIIAISGVALWYFSQAQKRENFILLILALVFTGLSSTDLFPKFVRDEYVWPYVLKAVPCILIWGKITFDLLVGNISPRIQESNL